MADNTVTGAVTSSIRPQARPTAVSGIGAKTPTKQEEKSEMSFREWAASLFTGFGGKDPNEKPASVNTHNAKISVYQDMEDEARRSAELARQDREGMGIKKSLTTEQWSKMYSNEKVLEPNVPPVGVKPLPAPSTSEGLMAPVTSKRPKARPVMAPVTSKRPKARPVIDEPIGFVDFFVQKMGDTEGMEDHIAPEGQLTLAYGILPRTARLLGVNPEDYPDRKSFATEVYGRMYNNARETYPDVFNGLTEKQSIGVLSLYINLGEIPKGVVNALSGADKDFSTAGKNLSEVIHFTSKTRLNKEGEGIKYASKGLSARRAGEYNILMAGTEGFVPVTNVSVTGTRAAPVFNWLDSEGNVIQSFASYRSLSPDNDMVTVEVR